MNHDLSAYHFSGVPIGGPTHDIARGSQLYVVESAQDWDLLVLDREARDALVHARLRSLWVPLLQR